MFAVTPDTWLISDTHFGHKNIVKYCNRPMNHNDLMINHWKQLVRPDDDVLHLGDFSVWYGPEEDYWLNIANEFPGNIYMLRGNHDKKKDTQYATRGITMIPEFIQELEYKQNLKRILFSHYPDVDRIGDWDVNIHGHIHNNPLDAKLAATNRRYINISVELMDYSPRLLSDIL